MTKKRLGLFQQQQQPDLCLGKLIHLIFVLCAEYDQVRAVLAWLYPDELSPERWNPSQLPWVTVSFLDSPEYAADCTLTWENVESKFDVSSTLIRLDVLSMKEPYFFDMNLRYRYS